MQASSSKLTAPNESLATIEELNLPAYKQSLLQVDFDGDSGHGGDRTTLPSIAWRRPIHPSAESSKVHDVPVISARVLTSEDAVKKTLELTLDITGKDIEFEPGDSFGVFCKNDVEEVDSILLRLGLLAQRNTLCKVHGKTSLKHLPSTPTSLAELLVDCCDIRAIPKKAFLRILSEHATDSVERQHLLELSSRQGSNDYWNLIVLPRISLLDMLNAFSSCLPPVECLLENLPPLQPRAYSISNSPLVDANCLKFVFNVVEIAAVDGRTYERCGICTKWLDSVTTPIQKSRNGDADQLPSTESIYLPIFMRKLKHFRLPTDHSKPLILIGPGTGVAPFIGFLEHRSALMKRTGSDANRNFGKVLLFYGCRHKERDFIYKDNLEAFKRDGVLSELFVCFSRDKPKEDTPPPPRYVQDCIRQNGVEVFRLIEDEQAFVFVCGDAQGMAKDVYETIVTLVQTHGEFEEADARVYVSGMQHTKRYLQDTWT